MQFELSRRRPVDRYAIGRDLGVIRWPLLVLVCGCVKGPLFDDASFIVAIRGASIDERKIILQESRKFCSL